MKTWFLALALCCLSHFALAQTSVTPWYQGNPVSATNPLPVTGAGGTPACTHFANPTATIGTTAVNGTATTCMRSDAAPAAPQASASTFGLAKVDGTTLTAAGGVFSAVAGGSGINQLTGDVTAGPGVGSQAATLANTAVTPGSYTYPSITVDAKGRLTAASNGTAPAAAANPTATIGTAAVNGTATTYMRSDAAPAAPQASASTFGLMKPDGTTLSASGGVVSLATPVSVGNGGTGANLSATGGAHRVLQQVTSGANITVGQLACADLSDAAGGCSTSGGTTVLNASALIETLPNDTSTGSTASKLLVYTSSAKVKTATVSDTSDVIGICVSGISGTGCTTSGNASVAIAGQATCVFDGATTAGDFVVASTTAAGDCHDAGNTVPATVQVLGYVLSTNGSGGTYAVDISNIGAMAALNSKVNPGGSNGQMQYNNSNKFGGFTLAGDCTFSVPNITCTKINGDANVAFLDANQSWTKGQAVTPVALTDASPIAVDASTSNGFTVTLAHTTATRQLANPTNLKAGQTLTFAVSQDSTGGAALTYDSDYKWSGGTAPTLTAAANAKDVITCWADTSATLQCTSLLNMH